MNNVRAGSWDQLPQHARKAVGEWLDTEPGRDTALLDVIIDDEDSQDAPWLPANSFETLTARLARHALSTASTLPIGDASRARFSVAVHMVRRLREDAESVTQEILAVLPSRPDLADLVAPLVAKLPDVSLARRSAAAEARRTKDAATRSANIKFLQPKLDEIRCGGEIGALGYAAKLYFQESQERPGVSPAWNTSHRT